MQAAISVPCCTPLTGDPGRPREVTPVAPPGSESSPGLSFSGRASQHRAGPGECRPASSLIRVGRRPALRDSPRSSAQRFWADWLGNERLVGKSMRSWGRMGSVDSESATSSETRGCRKYCRVASEADQSGTDRAAVMSEVCLAAARTYFFEPSGTACLRPRSAS